MGYRSYVEEFEVDITDLEGLKTFLNYVKNNEVDKYDEKK